MWLKCEAGTGRSARNLLVIFFQNAESMICRCVPSALLQSFGSRHRPSWGSFAGALGVDKGTDQHSLTGVIDQQGHALARALPEDSAVSAAWKAFADSLLSWTPMPKTP